MDYPSVYVVRLIGRIGILGVAICFDEDTAKEEIAARTGWPFEGVIVERVGDVSEVPIFVA